MAKNIRNIKTSDLDLKDRLVAINRVTKVTKGAVPSVFQRLWLWEMKTGLSAGALERRAK